LTFIIYIKFYWLSYKYFGVVANPPFVLAADGAGFCEDAKTNGAPVFGLLASVLALFAFFSLLA
jgi:hypothetical protein